MSLKCNKSIAAISLLTSLVVTFASANAGAAMSGKRYSTSAAAAAYRTSAAQQAPRDAFAAMDSVSASAHGGDGNAWQYVGGPKSPVPPSRGF
ncbi:hypothetical protein [Bradyrhizobium viridifuturi]|uniref:hypothetical protein n=1 Tax=Bradyrhizobium viridifuturi TaxID=1654716 RepID=UPI00067F20C8|nr:hypothetical protein [Bradyrhizobium viridifuturi]